MRTTKNSLFLLCEGLNACIKIEKEANILDPKRNTSSFNLEIQKFKMTFILRIFGNTWY